jgi:hypothetical protein
MQSDQVIEMQFPFIRFTNWKQDDCSIGATHPEAEVSIHTLHELEARGCSFYRPDSTGSKDSGHTKSSQPLAV